MKQAVILEITLMLVLVVVFRWVQLKVIKKRISTL